MMAPSWNVDVHVYNNVYKTKKSELAVFDI